MKNKEDKNLEKNHSTSQSKHLDYSSRKVIYMKRRKLNPHFKSRKLQRGLDKEEVECHSKTFRELHL